MDFFVRLLYAIYLTVIADAVCGSHGKKDPLGTEVDIICPLNILTVRGAGPPYARLGPGGEVQG